MNNRYFLLPLVILAVLCSILVGTPGSSSAQISPNGFAGRVNRYVNNTSFNGSFSTILGQAGTNTLFNPGCCGYYYGYPGTGYARSFSMPFAFSYDSTTYNSGSTIWMCYNGQVCFNSSGPSNTYGYGSEVGNSTWANTIFPWGGTYLCGFPTNYYDGFGYSGGMYYQVSGQVGNRVLTLEWHGYALYVYYGYQYGYVMQGMQVKLYEANNNIEFYYSSNGQYMTGYAPNIGLNGTSSPSFASNTILGGSNFNYSSYYTPPKSYQLVCPSLPPNVQLSTSPKVVTFLNTNVGTSVQTNITITNTGTATTPNLMITGTSISGNPDFTVVSTPGPLGPGASGNLVVQFMPQINGSRSATLTIISNGRDSGTQTITLNGTGLAPLIALDTNIIFKKTFTKMGQALIKRLIVKDTGTGTMIVNNVIISGIDAPQYSVVYSPPNPIPPGGFDSILVAYIPTIEGRHSATLTVYSNAINVPAYPVQLIGTATLPHITVVPNPLTFDSTYEGDSAVKTITITNPGSDTLRLSPNMLTSNDGDFTATLLTGGDTAIPPDHFKTVTVVFKPLQQGTRQARYFMRTNIIPTFEQPRRDTAGTVSVTITGNGVPFGVLAQTLGAATYDTTITGTQICRTDTLKNNGDADLTITSWALTGTNASIFQASGLTLPYTLKARTSVVIHLCATPTTDGLNTATFTINGKSNGKSQQVNISLNVYGLKVCDQVTPSALFSTGSTPELILENTDSTECVTVTNCGQVASTYTAKLSSSSSPDYTISSPTTSGSIAPNGTASFCVKFHPNSTTVENGTLVITTPDLPPLSVALGGSGACANVSAPAPTVPNTNAGGHGTFNISITNAGNYQW
ncbi:MAG TPA: choice-of-anchor D domain-containing protein, partial [Candidatus Kapabacteria bacterium]|nr:choice-of-anchor D domain-containing protein [Candidatus Kapabacteria bacterium]